MPTLPQIYKVTKYDPTDWNDAGRYVGPEVETSDHGPQEAAYLAAVAAFAQESGITELAIREPELTGFVNFGLEAPIEGHGLAGLFAADLSDFYDGALVPVEVALELIRAMLRDNGAWCRLEVEDRFLVHIGFDQYMYIGSTTYCERALKQIAELGLFAVRLDESPYSDLDQDARPARPADAEFWNEVAALAEEHSTVLLAEQFLQNAYRWHQVTAETLGEIRQRLAPRAIVEIWADLSTDLEAVRLQAAPMLSCQLVWANAAGRLRGEFVEEPAELVIPAEATAATVISSTLDGYNPLLQGVLPDADGVLRARWLPFS